MPNKLPYPEPPKGVNLIVWLDYIHEPTWTGEKVFWLAAKWDGKRWSSREFPLNRTYRPSEIGIVAWSYPPPMPTYEAKP